MGHSNGKITAPVSINDVKYVLGAASNDLGTLCTHRNINMWSKIKPVSFNKLSELKESGVQVNEYKGDDHIHSPFGITIPYEASDMRLLYGQKITYSNRPKGGINSPYRLTDFNGYNHNCKCPWNIRIPDGEISVSTKGVLARFTKNDDAYKIDGNIKLEDLSFQGGFMSYVAVGVFDPLTNSPAECRTFDDGNPTVAIEESLTFQNASPGTELVVIFGFTGSRIPSWSTVAEQTFYAMDCAGMPATGSFIVTKARVSTWQLQLNIEDKDGKKQNFLHMVSRETTQPGATLSGSATWIGKPTKYYELKSVTVDAYSIDDPKMKIGTGTITDIDMCQLPFIDSSSYVEVKGEGTVAFSVPVNNSVVKDGNGNTVSGGAIYKYIMNYIET